MKSLRENSGLICVQIKLFDYILFLLLYMVRWENDYDCDCDLIVKSLSGTVYDKNKNRRITWINE